MLSVKLSSEKVEHLVIKGSLEDIVADSLGVLYLVHDNLKKYDEDSAKMYKIVVENAIKDGIVFTGDESHDELFERMVNRLSKLMGDNT